MRRSGKGKEIEGGIKESESRKRVRGREWKQGECRKGREINVKNGREKSDGREGTW